MLRYLRTSALWSSLWSSHLVMSLPGRFLGSASCAVTHCLSASKNPEEFSRAPKSFFNYFQSLCSKLPCRPFTPMWQGTPLQNCCIKRCFFSCHFCIFSETENITVPKYSLVEAYMCQLDGQQEKIKCSGPSLFQARREGNSGSASSENNSEMSTLLSTSSFNQFGLFCCWVFHLVIELDIYNSFFPLALDI